MYTIRKRYRILQLPRQQDDCYGEDEFDSRQVNATVSGTDPGVYPLSYLVRTNGYSRRTNTARLITHPFSCSAYLRTRGAEPTPPMHLQTAALNKKQSIYFSFHGPTNGGGGWWHMFYHALCAK